MKKNEDMDKLTVKQQKAMMLVIEGKTWGQIATELRIANTTLWNWRRSEVWQEEFGKIQRTHFRESGILLSTYVSNGFKKLYTKAMDDTLSPRSQIEALKVLLNTGLTHMTALENLDVEKRLKKLELLMKDVIEDNEEEDDDSL